MAYVQKGKHTYQTRVINSLAVSRIVTCETTDEATAGNMDAMLDLMVRRRQWKAVDAIVAQRLTLAKVYDAYEVGELDELLQGLDDADLDPLVTEWDGKGSRAQSDKYVAQVRLFIPAGVLFPASQFTRKKISQFLAGLAVSNATKNRYRAALAQFAAWLVEREVLAHNPLKDVRGYGVKRQAKVIYEPHQVRALVEAQSGNARVLGALFAGTGVEWGAAEAVTRRDIDLDNRLVYAKGTKNQYRNRWVEVSEDWAWEIIEAAARSLTPSARLVEISEKVALKNHEAARVLLQLPKVQQPLHGHRSHFTVMHLRRGSDHQWIKNQLGHAPNSTLLYTTYGVYIAEIKLRDAVRPNKQEGLRLAK